VAESDIGYVWSFEVYRGVDPEPDNSAAVGVVKCLLGQLTKKGHTVCLDCSCTSLALAEELAKANTGLAETIMISTEELPKGLKEAKIRKGKQVFHQKKNVPALQ
jgi:hypothetical protein